MKNFIFKSIDEILQSSSVQLALPLQQKAKFEGWLKIELAAKLQKQFCDTVLEPRYTPKSQSHADISSDEYFIELKTSDTNCTYNNANVRRKRFSGNRKAIEEAIKKLQASGNKGIIAFVLFPWNASCKANIDSVRNMLKKNNIVEGPSIARGFYIFVAEV